MAALSRHVVPDSRRKQAVSQLQDVLIDLIDLALQGKQAHWNVVGPNFRSIHLQLDDIIASARRGSDAVAERILALGEPAEGRSASIAEGSRLPEYPVGLQPVEKTVTLVADRLAKTVAGLREAIKSLDDADLVSQDLVIGLCSELEKHLWMVQSQEG